MPGGKLVFHLFGALAEFEGEVNRHPETETLNPDFFVSGRINFGRAKVGQISTSVDT